MPIIDAQNRNRRIAISDVQLNANTCARREHECAGAIHRRRDTGRTGRQIGVDQTRNSCGAHLKILIGQLHLRACTGCGVHNRKVQCRNACRHACSRDRLFRFRLHFQRAQQGLRIHIARVRGHAPRRDARDRVTRDWVDRDRARREISGQVNPETNLQIALPCQDNAAVAADACQLAQIEIEVGFKLCREQAARQGQIKYELVLCGVITKASRQDAAILENIKEALRRAEIRAVKAVQQTCRIVA